MELKTTRFGSLNVPDSNIINFPEGIIGFENFKKYVILCKKENSPLRWLQCIEEPSLAFIIINPLMFKPDYAPTVDKQDLAVIKLKDSKEAEVLSIVVVPDDPRDMVANLMAPILINPGLCIAKQVIVKDLGYPTRYKILDSFKEQKASEQALSC